MGKFLAGLPQVHADGGRVVAIIELLCPRSARLTPNGRTRHTIHGKVIQTRFATTQPHSVWPSGIVRSVALVDLLSACHFT